jgi:hypothetical protein
LTRWVQPGTSAETWRPPEARLKSTIVVGRQSGKAAFACAVPCRFWSTCQSAQPQVLLMVACERV